MCTTRSCLTCNREIKGRADKKFCDDECRNMFHNNRNRITSGAIRQINNILKNNYQILQNLHSVGVKKVHRRKLSDRGYEFAYFTNLYETRKGKTYSFCYDRGILPINDDYYAIVEKEAYVD